MVVDYDGRVLAEASAGPGQRIVVAPINIDALRQERQRRVGHSMPAQLRTELYTEQRKAVFQASSGAKSRTIEKQTQLIEESRSKLDFGDPDN